MGTFICPACGSETCRFEAQSKETNAIKINCNSFDTSFFIGNEILGLEDESLKSKLFNLITELISQKRKWVSEKKDFDWFFIYQQNPSSEYEVPHCVNLFDLMNSYPSNIVEHVSRALLCISNRFPNVGQRIAMNPTYPLIQRFLFCASNKKENEAVAIIRYLHNLNLIEGNIQTPMPIVSITFDGWERIDELTKRLAEVNQGFIAMSYSEEAKPILETFRTAIQESGFDARIIGEKEHNHQIVPEMFFEIERSKFMVVDVTHQNYGAYYEAGYAQALGKEVIVCCSKEVFDDPKKKPHFDIAQKPIIIWTDFEDLKARLIRRIQATVH